MTGATIDNCVADRMTSGRCVSGSFTGLEQSISSSCMTGVLTIRILSVELECLFFLVVAGFFNGVFEVQEEDGEVVLSEPFSFSFKKS